MEMGEGGGLRFRLKTQVLVFHVAIEVKNGITIHLFFHKAVRSNNHIVSLAFEKCQVLIFQC